ncbi:unnamed protein product [Urochloa decumbens]|uniref:Uncharacterized protein n=1 Tax=Urochloa decumbens TaxID=240449 RepID=A0ABC8ZZB6_9POAL
MSSTPPLDDEYEERRAQAYRDHNIIWKQFPVLLEKLDALDPPKKRTRRSAKKKKSDDRPALTPEIRAHYKEMGVTLKGFLKELGDDVDGARRRPEAARARHRRLHRHRHHLQRETSSERRRICRAPCPAALAE